MRLNRIFYMWIRKPVRYNRGMLRKEKRAIGTVWVFRWSEEANGQRRQHKDVMGTENQILTKANRRSPKQQNLGSVGLL
jgi:hypothetical protein